MNKENYRVTGSIIGLKKEFEEQYIVLHKHTFPGVLDRISHSNISDYSIFLHNGILFSHMVYTGTDIDADMQALSSDKTTQEWWKLTDRMQQPLQSRKDNEWWAEIKLWFGHEFKSLANGKTVQYAYTVPTPADMPETIPNDFFGDIDFWG